MSWPTNQHPLFFSPKAEKISALPQGERRRSHSCRLGPSPFPTAEVTVFFFPARLIVAPVGKDIHRAVLAGILVAIGISPWVVGHGPFQIGAVPFLHPRIGGQGGLCGVRSGLRGSGGSLGYVSDIGDGRNSCRNLGSLGISSGGRSGSSGNSGRSSVDGGHVTASCMWFDFAGSLCAGLLVV